MESHEICVPARQRGSTLLVMDSELHKAVDKRYGKYANIRVVHPMDTYIRGRRHGIYVGAMLAFAAYALHEIHFHDWHNVSFWHIGLLSIAIFAAFWTAYKSEPNKIAVDVRKSTDIYKDELSNV